MAWALCERVEHQVTNATALGAWWGRAEPITPRGVPGSGRCAERRATGAKRAAAALCVCPEFRAVPEGPLVVGVMGEVFSEVFSMIHTIPCDFQ